MKPERTVAWEDETLSRQSRVSEGAGFSVTHTAIGSEAVQ
jgi:hypothetical protein